MGLYCVMFDFVCFLLGYIYHLYWGYFDLGGGAEGIKFILLTSSKVGTVRCSLLLSDGVGPVAVVSFIMGIEWCSPLSSY